MISRDIWGSHFWNTIHFVALGLPHNPEASDKQAYKSFYTNLVHIIPCQECADHLRENFSKLPNIDDYLNSPRELFNWTVQLHNVVNKMLGRREWSQSYAYYYYKNPFFNFWKFVEYPLRFWWLIILIIIVYIYRKQIKKIVL